MATRRAIAGILFASVAMVSLMVAQPATAVDADYTQGAALYKAGKYREASVCFSKCVQKDPKNSAAYYSLGNCLSMCGQTGAARGWYQALLTRFPNSQYAALAKDMLSRTANGGGGGGSLAGAGKAGRSATAAADVPKPKSRIPSEKLIVVVPPKADRPPCSAKFLQAVKQALASMPSSTVSYLYEQGCRVYATPTLIDKNPELQNTHPKGYEEGHTFKQSPAIFDGTNVVVCEYTMDPDTDALEPCGDALGSVRHEFGHAVDWYLGQLSETPEYKHAYYLDLGRVSEEDKVKLNYYCQKAERGLHECFAEVYSGITGGPASDDKWRVEQNQGVMANFKGVRGFIDSVLKQMDR